MPSALPAPGAPSDRADALPTAVVAVNTAAFTLCFAAWVAFGPSARILVEAFGVPGSLAAVLKAVPILVGSVLRIPVGILTDRFGARRMFPLLMLSAAAAAGWISLAGSAAALFAGGALLGLVGTTFAVGVQSVSSWTPRAKQGLALGVFGAGNVGTALTTFGLPLLIVSAGWRVAFQVYAAVMVAAAAGYWLLIRDAARRGPAPSAAALLAPLKSPRAWSLGLYYMATFGVFVAATLTLSDVYVDAYGVSLPTAGLLATTFTFSASLCRIPGGWLADRFGAAGVVRVTLGVVILALAPVAQAPALPVTVCCVFAAGLALGVGMAASMKYVPDFFPTSVGAVGGIVGALGGVGGFLLPLAGQALKSAGAGACAQVLPLLVVVLAAALVQVAAESRRAAAPAQAA